MSTSRRHLTVGPPQGQGSNLRSANSFRQPEPLAVDTWPGNMDIYMPELDVGKSISKRIERNPGKGLFCRDDHFTSVEVLEKPSSEYEPVVWGHHNLAEKIRARHPGFRMMCLRMEDEEPTGNQGNPASRLTISREMFKHVADNLRLPPSFINCLMKYRGGAPIFQGSRLYTPRGGDKKKPVYDFWNIMRIRTARSCLDKPPHTHGSDKHHPHADEYQMDPFNLLHLPLKGTEVNADILAFELGIFFRHDTFTNETSVLTINTGTTKVKELNPKDFQDAVNAVFQHAESDPVRERKDPFWFHLVYTGLALQNWRAALLKFQAQLIKHDETIEDHIAGNSTKGSIDRPNVTGNQDDSESVDGLSAKTNQSLHAMTAHGLRYETELVGLVNVIEELLEQHRRIQQYLLADEEEWARVHDALLQRLAEAKSVVALQRELAKKTKNTLAFLFHAITSKQATLQTENGSDLKKILGLNQRDVALTIMLSKQMRTIAWVTMIFLPAATIAAVMSLPYFDDEKRKQNVDARNYAISTALITLALLLGYYVHYRIKMREEGVKAARPAEGINGVQGQIGMARRKLGSLFRRGNGGIGNDSNGMKSNFRAGGDLETGLGVTGLEEKA